MTNEVDIRRLHELFRLDEESGLLYRLALPRNANSVKTGSVAGYLTSEGYRNVKVDGRQFKVHRIIFAMANGRWPKHEIDHIDGIKDNNRPSNLREATKSQNKQNAGAPCTNTSGCKGVSWHKTTGSWIAQIKVNGKRLHLGLFTDIAHAAEARDLADRKYFGEFRHQAQQEPTK